MFIVTCTDSPSIVFILFISRVSYLSRPSFPTRRSSDLESTIVARRASIDWATSLTSRTSRASVSHGVRSRSEEHTSELQSPCNLVCRLLLEKKNNHHLSEDVHVELSTYYVYFTVSPARN